MHTLCAFSQINAPVSNISKLAFFKCILKTECFKTFCQRSIRSIPYKLSGKTNILENRRRVTKKNVAILADSLPLSASRHNTMFLKNWQHLLYVYFSCVSGTNKSKQHHNKIKREGDFESANQITAKNHNIGERQAPYKRSNNNLANSC